MSPGSIRDEYFRWMVDTVCKVDLFHPSISFEKLMAQLHDTEFKYYVGNDVNRAEDGISLRYRFASERGYDDWSMHGPCSILEMMVALAIRCEETIMDDPRFGNRTRQWFWGMIKSLGLGGMTDYNYDEDFVSDTLSNFLYHDYSPTGKGGLFTVRSCDRDLRKVEIWYQMCWYLDSIT